MQLVFLTTHLPAYLDICGMDPMLSAKALGLIGGFNVLGSLFSDGRAGGSNCCCSAVFIFAGRLDSSGFSMPADPETTMIFSAVMGFLWLGVSPLVQG
jgi:hypothetical protein